MSAEKQFFILKHNGRRSRILLPPNIQKPKHHERLVLTFAPYTTTSFNLKKRATDPSKYPSQRFHFLSLNTVGAVCKLNDKEKNENCKNSSSIVETRAVFKIDGENVKNEQRITKGEGEKGYNKLVEELPQVKSHGNSGSSSSALFTFGKNFEEDAVPRVCRDLLDDIITSISKSSPADTPIISSTRNVNPENVKNEQCIAKREGEKGHNRLLEEFSQAKSHENTHPSSPTLFTFSKNFEQDSVPRVCCDLLNDIIATISKSSTSDTTIISSTRYVDSKIVKNEQCVAKGDEKQSNMLLEEVSRMKNCKIFDPSFPALSTFGRNFVEDSVPKACNDLLDDIISVISKSSTADAPKISSALNVDLDCVKNGPHIVEGNGQRNGVLLEKISQPKSHENFTPLFSTLPTPDRSFEEDSIPKVCRDLLNAIIPAISESLTSDTLIISPAHDNHECTKNKQNVAKGGDRKKHFMHLQDVSQLQSHGNLDPLLSLSPTFSEKFDGDSIPKTCQDLLYDIINGISESPACNGTVADLDCVKNEPHVANGNGQRQGILLEEVSQSKHHENFVPSFPTLTTFGENFKEGSIPKVCRNILDGIITSISESSTSGTPIILPAHNDHKRGKDKLRVSKPSSKSSEITFIPGIRLQGPGNNCFFALVPVHPNSLSSVNARNRPYDQQFCLVMLNKIALTNSEGEMKSKQPGNGPTTTSKAAIFAKVHCCIQTWPAERYDPTKFSIYYVKPTYIRVMQKRDRNVIYKYDRSPASYNKTTGQKQLNFISYKTTQQELLLSVPHGPHLLVELKCSLIKIGPFKFQASRGSPFLIATVTSSSISFRALTDTIILKPIDIKELIYCTSPDFPLMLIDVTAKCANDLCDEKIIPRNPAFRIAWKNQRRITFLITCLDLVERLFLEKVFSSGSFRTTQITENQANDLLFRKPAQTEITWDNQLKINVILAPRPQLLSTRPQLPPTRPQLPPTRPQLPLTRLQLPPTRPQLPPTGPQLPPTRPQLPPTRPQLPPTRPQLPSWQLLPPEEINLPDVQKVKPVQVLVSNSIPPPVPLLSSSPKVTIPIAEEYVKQKHHPEKSVFCIRPNTVEKTSDIHDVRNCMEKTAREKINFVKKSSSNPNLFESEVNGNSKTVISFESQSNKENISSEQDNNFLANSVINNENAWQHVNIKQEEDATETNSPEIPKAKAHQVLASDSIQQLPSPQIPLSTNTVAIPSAHFVITEASEKQRNLPENNLFSIKLNTAGKTSDIHNAKHCSEKIAESGINFLNKFSNYEHLSGGQVKENLKNVISSKNLLDNVNTSRHGNNTNSLVNVEMNNENDLQHLYIKQEDVNTSLDEKSFSDSFKFNSTNVVEEEHFGHSVSSVRIKVEDNADDLFLPEDCREAMKEDDFSKRFIQNILCDTDIMEVEKVVEEIQSRKREEEKVPEVERDAESESVFQNPIRNIYDYEKCLKNNNFIPQCNIAFSDENRINTNSIATKADSKKWSNVNNNNVNDISSTSGCSAQSSIEEESNDGIFSVEDYREESKQHILKCHIEKYMKDILPLKNTFNTEIKDIINAEVNRNSSAPNPPVCMQDVPMHVKTKTSQPLAIEKSCNNNNNIADSVKLRKRTCCNNEKYPKPKLKRKLEDHYMFRSVPPLDETVSNKSITALPSSHSKTALTDDLGDQRLPHSIRKAPKIVKKKTWSRSLKNVEADATASSPSKENPLVKKRSTLSWSRKVPHKLKGWKQEPNFINGSYYTTKKYKKVNCQLVHHPKFDDSTLSLLESSNTHGVNAISKTSLPSIKASPTNLTSKCKKSNTENSSLPEHTVRESCDKHSTDIPYSKTLHSNKIRPSLKLRIKKCVNGFKGALIEDGSLVVDADKLKDEKFCESRASKQYKDAVCNKTPCVQPIVTKGLSNSKVSNSRLRMEKTNNSTHEVRERLKIDQVITNSFNVSKNVNDCD